MIKPSIPQGMRDFDALTIAKRKYIFNAIEKQFKLFGFTPLETPTMENLDTLVGKYGDEGDKLIFKVLNNGLDNPQKKEMAREAFEQVIEGKNTSKITERALRYDLTIPFARYVATNHNQLPNPFKRYQIQPVWRADRPQKGRYREFYQCDADIVGSNSLWNEVELVQLYVNVFNELNLPVTIKINSRKVLYGLAATCNAADKLTDITVAIDKLDKIGEEKVIEELAQRNIDHTSINTILQYLKVSGDNTEKLNQIGSICKHSEFTQQGIDEVLFVLDNLQSSTAKIEFDPTLARGLNYYTGLIIEVKANGVEMGSIGGGGRYDDLTSLFGLKNMSGVGISFGVDRIYDVMEMLQLFPTYITISSQVLFFNLGKAEAAKSFELLQHLRNRGISGELFTDQTKFDKQFKYAEKKQIKYAIIIGEQELVQNCCNVKNLVTGQQTTVSFNDLLHFNFE